MRRGAPTPCRTRSQVTARTPRVRGSPPDYVARGRMWSSLGGSARPETAGGLLRREPHQVIGRGAPADPRQAGQIERSRSRSTKRRLVRSTVDPSSPTLLDILFADTHIRGQQD